MDRVKAQYTSGTETFPEARGVAADGPQGPGACVAPEARGKHLPTQRSDACAQVVSLPLSRVKGGRSGSVAPRPRILHPRRGSTAHSRGDCLRRGVTPEEGAQAMPCMICAPPRTKHAVHTAGTFTGGVHAGTREWGTPVYYSADEVGTPPASGRVLRRMYN